MWLSFQAKLGELQSLVMQLLGEKHMLHSYNEETLRPPNSPDVNIQPHLSNTRQLTNGDLHNVHNGKKELFQYKYFCCLLLKLEWFVYILVIYVWN